MKQTIRFDSLLFKDLSHHLDYRLDWHAVLFSALESELLNEEKFTTELAEVLFEYLGQRAALEHVFLGRSLRNARLEKTKLAAEVWRYRKIQIRAALIARNKKTVQKKSRKSTLKT